MDILFSFVASALVMLYIHYMFKLNKQKPKALYASQSKNVLSFNNRIDKLLEPPTTKKTQASDYVARTNVKAIVVEDQIYWIANNAFYTANLVDGHIEENSTRLVDTMTMDKVQLEKMIFIVDKLKEGE